MAAHGSVRGLLLIGVHQHRFNGRHSGGNTLQSGGESPNSSGKHTAQIAERPGHRFLIVFYGPFSDRHCRPWIPSSEIHNAALGRRPTKQNLGHTNGGRTAKVINNRPYQRLRLHATCSSAPPLNAITLPFTKDARGGFLETDPTTRSTFVRYLLAAVPAQNHDQGRC